MYATSLKIITQRLTRFSSWFPFFVLAISDILMPLFHSVAKNNYSKEGEK
jgi:hypothetical protein